MTAPDFHGIIELLSPTTPAVLQQEALFACQQAEAAVREALATCELYFRAARRPRQLTGLEEAEQLIADTKRRIRGGGTDGS